MKFYSIIIFSAAILVLSAFFPTADVCGQPDAEPKKTVADEKKNSLADFGIAGVSIRHDDVKEPPVVYATPDLRPEPGGKINISEDMDVREQIARLISEVEKLKAFAARVTLIISLDLQMTNPSEFDGVEISISGGNLEKPVSCETNQYGQCVFVLPPIASEKAPDYMIKTKKKKFKSTEKKIRPNPGTVVFLPIRVDLLQQELDKRINPPVPSK